jgi:hypothetical protein
MHSETVLASQLTATDISSILNLICPRCGGPLGGASQEFKCQGRCRTDWRDAWDHSRRVMILTKPTRRRRSRKTACRTLRQSDTFGEKSQEERSRSEHSGDPPFHRH